MNSKDRRRLWGKIKLNELKNHINEALSEAKSELLKKSKMTENQFNLFIQNNEQKITENISEKSKKVYNLKLSIKRTGSKTEKKRKKNFQKKK